MKKENKKSKEPGFFRKRAEAQLQKSLVDKKSVPRPLTYIVKVSAFAVIILFFYELIKARIFTDVTSWESHFIPIFMMAIIAAVVAYFVFKKKQSLLYYNLIRENEERILSEKALKETEEKLLLLNVDKVEIFVKQFNSTAKSTYKLLEDILMWVGAQQGKIPFKPHIIGFRDICLDILETLNPTARAKNISINYSASDEINLFADVDMLKTVLRNLVSNAIKFTNDGGTINIDAEENIENVTISVSDNGVGIAPDALKKLFDITEVLTTKGTAGETGTGLGTLLCKEIVDKHQGKIWVESTLGEGSKFFFTVPGETDQKEFTY